MSIKVLWRSHGALVYCQHYGCVKQLASKIWKDDLKQYSEAGGVTYAIYSDIIFPYALLVIEKMVEFLNIVAKITTQLQTWNINRILRWWNILEMGLV